MKLWEGLVTTAGRATLKRQPRLFVNNMAAHFLLIMTRCSLPGIGSYTAGAIASIAFGLPYPAVDGNVLRVVFPWDRLRGRHC